MKVIVFSYINKHQSYKVFSSLVEALTVRSEDSAVTIVDIWIFTLDSRRGILGNTFFGKNLEWCKNVCCSFNGISWRNDIRVRVAGVCPWV